MFVGFFLLKNNRSNSKTHRLVDSRVFFTKRALYLLQLESLTHLKINFFSFMKLVWLPGNHTNHIWPCMITGKNATQKLIILLTLVCFFTKRALYLLRLESLTHLKINFFSFMKLVWLPGNHTNHIWPCMITGKNATQKLIILLTLECFFTKRALYLLRLQSLTHLQLKFFSFMKLVWLPGNHTNHIWPCMITGKNEYQKLIAGLVWCISYRMSAIAVTIRVV